MSSDSRARFNSPELVATEDFAITNETIRTLMGQSKIISYNLCFFKPRNRIPRFGFSTVPLKTLISLIDTSKIKQLPTVKMHSWSEMDCKIWEDRMCDNDSSIHITFRRCDDKPTIIEVIFSHENINSSIYSYKINDDGNDAYFIIFVPKYDIELKRISLLSNYDYLSQLTRGIMHKTSKKKFVPNECISCYSNIAEMVFLPCGHTSFCKKCADSYQNTSCPICKQHLEVKVRRTMAANFCLMCPPRFNCTEVNAMLIPCHCVVGCIRTTTVAVIPGEECPNCEQHVEDVQQIYY